MNARLVTPAVVVGFLSTLVCWVAAPPLRYSRIAVGTPYQTVKQSLGKYDFMFASIKFKTTFLWRSRRIVGEWQLFLDVPSADHLVSSRTIRWVWYK